MERQMNGKKTVAVIGSNGQLGSELIQVLTDDTVIPLEGPPKHDVDITDIENVRTALVSGAVDFVVNTAAFTHVPRCEEMKSLAFHVNATGAKNVAAVCREIGAYLIHISTDYVFDGKKAAPYIEDDSPNPLNYYGFTKLEAEKMIKKETDRFYIVRTSGLYGHRGCLVKGENFVDKVLRLQKEGQALRVVKDEVLTPTSAKELALQIKKIIEACPMPGVYHATNQGQCSWYTFTEEIFRIQGIDSHLIPISQKDFHDKVQRPLYSVLENHKLKQAGIDVMTDWRIALKEYLHTKEDADTHAGKE